MGLYCEFNLSEAGFWETTKNGGFVVDYSEGNQIFANTFHNIVSAYCPIKTGYLIGSTHCSSNGMNTTAYATADYAQYVEFGTSQQAEQPFFTMAVEMAFIEAYPIWVESYEQALELEYWYVYDQVWAQTQTNSKQNDTFASNWSHNAATASINSQRTYYPITPEVIIT